MLVFKDGAMISNAFVPTFIALTKLTRIGISSLLFACTIVKTQGVNSIEILKILVNIFVEILVLENSFQ